MPANGPDCAWLAELAAEATSNVTAANIRRRANTKNCGARPALLARRFPSTATRYACRCPIPLPRSGVATELAIRICTMDRDPHKAFASNATGNVCAGRRHLTISDGHG